MPTRSRASGRWARWIGTPLGTVASAGLALLTATGLTFLAFSAAPSGDPDPTAPEAASHGWSERQKDVIRTALAKKREKILRKGPKRFDMPKEAQEYFVNQRLPIGENDVPAEHLLAELEKLKGRERDLALTAGGTSWRSIGPGNVGGRTRAIVIDPTRPNVMFAAGVTGGIWKSVDGGASWQSTGDFLPNLAVSTLAIDPRNANVVYAGTGEGFFANVAMHRGVGIFKSEDSGATWNLLGGTSRDATGGAFSFVNRIVVSPNDSNRVYAATWSGVWRSLDAGQTWAVVLRNPSVLGSPPGVQATNGCLVGCNDLVVRPGSNPEVLFAAFGSFQKDGLYRSTNGGNSWVEFQTAPQQGRMTLAIAPSDSDRMYIFMAQNSSGTVGKLYALFRSDDGGNSWYSPLDFGHPFTEWLMSYVSIATGCIDHPVIYSQGWYDNAIAVDPVDPDVVWVGGIDIYRSDDGGRTFGMGGYWFYYLLDPPPPTYIHPDQHTIVFHPDYDGVTNQTMFVGNDGGIFRTTNARAATTQEECGIGPDPGPPPEIAWESLNNGYGVTQYYHGDSARDVDVFVGGAQDNGSSRVRSDATPDDWKLIYGGDGGYVAIDPTNSQRMFIEIQFFPTILVSLDGGETFDPAINGITDTDGLFITPFAMDPSNPDILWTGGQRPWRTTNGAASWQIGGPNLGSVNRISAIAIAPSNSNVVYLGYENGFIAKSNNALAPSPTWTLQTSGLTAGGYVSSVAVDPVNPDIAYCTYSNYGISHVRRKASGSSNWVAIDGIAPNNVPDIPAHWIAVRPTDSSELYVGTELGAFKSDDAGATWQPFNQGLAHTIVETLDFKDDHTLVAFTHGRGAFLVDLDPICDNGTVNSGAGPVTDVLFVNGLNGGSNRTVTVNTGDPIAVNLDAAPAGSGAGLYSLWLWNTGPTGCFPLVVGSETLGNTVNPTPLDKPTLGSPQPYRCLRSLNLPASLCGSVRELSSPVRVPWMLTKRGGFGSPAEFTLQGIIRDQGAGNPLGFSVTNWIVLRIR